MSYLPIGPMQLSLSLLLFVIFLALGLIHFYWALGGQKGFELALPTKENGEGILSPRAIDCSMVGVVLLAFAPFYLLQSELFTFSAPNWLFQIGSWFIPAIFLLRAIGDFKYVGFFKTVTNTSFGKRDSKLFSPLCFLIGTIGFAVALM